MSGADASLGTVLVLGATSPVARGAAAAFARRGHPIHLAARDVEDARRIAADLAVRHGVPVRVDAFDALDTAGHGAFVDGVMEAAGGALDGVVLAFGLLGDQGRAETDFDHAREILDVNLTGAASVLTHLANRLEARGRGFIVGITSVAGDRGRASNYVYGAAKGGFTVFLQGLRGRLAKHGVKVVTVKPGYVDTRMTFGRPGIFYAAPPDAVGEGIARAVEAGREVVYLPHFWRAIMTVVRHVPEKLFKRLKL